MEIVYEVVKTIDAKEVAEVFRNSEINRPLDDLGRMQRMIDNSEILAIARCDGRIVGFARAITDDAYCAYLPDLAVDKEFQRSGIGKELVRLVRKKLGDGITLILVSAPTAVDYYPRLGFEKMDKGFWIRRKC